jgi:hypothetical protein
MRPVFRNYLRHNCLLPFGKNGTAAVFVVKHFAQAAAVRRRKGSGEERGQVNPRAARG